MNDMPIIVWAWAIIGLAVLAAMIVSVFSVRALPADGPSTVSSSKMTEVVWALVPIAIMLATSITVLRMSEFAPVPAGVCSIQPFASCGTVQQTATAVRIAAAGALPPARSAIAPHP